MGFGYSEAMDCGEITSIEVGPFPEPEEPGACVPLRDFRHITITAGDSTIYDGTIEGVPEELKPLISMWFRH
jgi:hypothetical protein